MSRPSYVQMERLVQFLEDNPGLAKGHIRSAQARLQNRIKWEKVATELNSLGGANKNPKSWAKYWIDKKYALKKFISNRSAEAIRTGVDEVPISELDERLVTLMGGPTFAQDDQEICVPFHIPMESASLSEDLHSPNEPEVLLEQPETPPVDETQHSSFAASRHSPYRRRERSYKSKLHLERQRLIALEEKRVEAELANAAGWGNLVRAIDNLANAITTSGNKIAEALRH